MSSRSFHLWCASSAFIFLWALSGCSERQAPEWLGYAEGEFAYVAAARSGRLANLEVQRGEMVPVGRRLFVLDAAPESLARAEAVARADQARYRLADLGSGARPSELASLEARLSKAKAEQHYALAEKERRERLQAAGAIGREEYERALTALRTAEATVADLAAQRDTALLGGRSSQQRAAAAELAAAHANVAQAEWALQEKTVAARLPGLIVDTLYQPGEFVVAGAPVVVLLPQDQVQARFFVSEPELATLKPGLGVLLSVDGRADLAAEICYISPQAEYTPPVIYSTESRSRLVYLVKARLEPGSGFVLNPGQPLTVRLRSAP